MSRMKELVDALNMYAYQYYVLDEPTIADKEYDALFDELKALEEQTQVVLPDSPTHRVGGSPLSSFTPHRHLGRLWSLDKVKTREEFLDWDTRIRKLLAGQEITYVLQHKIDGLTINLTYEGGRLVQAATRGNGQVGEAILPQVQTIRSIPLSIPSPLKFEVQGEGYMPLDAFAAYNAQASEPLKNARNGAAGALRNLDPQETAKRKLGAFFYSVGYMEENAPFQDYMEMLQFLRENRLPVAEPIGCYTDANALYDEVERMAEQRKGLNFLTDGLVAKVCDFSQQRALGYTDRFPRWAMAIKFEAEEATTRLLSVSWDVGRTGKLTPLAHLEPVEIGGITVQKATLNNPGDIARKKVAIGSRVWIRRSNDVIPEIMGAVDEGTEPVQIPTQCPYCGSEVEQRGANLFCTNVENCRQSRLYQLAHFCSRDGMDIEGLSEKTLAVLMDECSVELPYQLYELTCEELLSLEGFQERRANNLLQAIEQSKQPPLDKFLFALGIKNVGKRTARDLAERFLTLEGVMDASFEQLVSIPDIGEIVAQSIVQAFQEESMKKNLEGLHRAGVLPQAISAAGPLVGKNIVFTGTLTHYTRGEIESLARENGANVQSAVGKSTDFLVAGEKAGSKRKKAEELGIEILTEEEFLSLL